VYERVGGPPRAVGRLLAALLRRLGVRGRRGQLFDQAGAAPCVKKLNDQRMMTRCGFWNR